MELNILCNVMTLTAIAKRFCSLLSSNTMPVQVFGNLSTISSRMIISVPLRISYALGFFSKSIVLSKQWLIIYKVMIFLAEECLYGKQTNESVKKKPQHRAVTFSWWTFFTFKVSKVCIKCDMIHK